MRLSPNAKGRTKAIVTVTLMLSSLGLMGCSELLYRQTCVGFTKDMRYCLAPLPQHFGPATDKPPAKPSSNQPAANPAGTDSSNQSQQGDSKAKVSSQSFSQKVSIKVGDNTHELLTQLELEGERMTLVGLAPLGQALFTLVYDGNTLSSEQSQLLGNEFKAEYLMAMMQLIYWPEQSIRSHLEGGSLVTGLCDAIPCRQFYSQDTLISYNDNQTQVIQIRYQHQTDDSLWQAHINLTMPQAKFELEIQPI
ncbi:DUF3261 domain-containing protein [Shewanella xiamenensis]|uniref:DUF3261 domain-containing protein n=1 Tax=Shewanella xiamenensis TaxID=332186 RepID=UPI0024A6384A|nr:DUF3261 domain-containing protein [Shewanella xiamenensis]MDI5835209.1 DUF3261 domain-containing protein [Shewanella xiamenensis]MDI5839008.1 DUF3261 domain-containing protein [Shewanella xiamenensis]MDI5843097.1 DUF3261 domain-containing protein [Shewanella xiamenensis]MDI5846972.1 DUF3261 domain-containing protein [Shewanella xiamenensis]MDI5851248.1 DUF3261 domain-containing protein [Shewanella xiamenensis]